MTQATSFPEGVEARQRPLAGATSELIRQTVAAHPGLPRKGLVALLAPLGVNPDSVGSLLSQLAERKIVRSEKHVNASGREVAHFWLEGQEASPPSAQPAAAAPPAEPKAKAKRKNRTDEATQQRMRDAAAKARATLAAKRAAAKAAGLTYAKAKLDEPAPVAPPVVAPVVAPVEAAESAAVAPDSRKRKVTRWSQEEIEALCRKWAGDHVNLAAPLSDKALLHLSRRDNCGYRPRATFTAALRDKFIHDHLPLVQHYIKELREAKTKAAAAPAPAPAPAEPAAAAAPPPEAELSFGALLDRALQRTVQDAVKQSVMQAESRMLAAMQEMLKGIPGYNRPLIIKHETAAAPEPAKPKYQVVIVNALPAQFHSVQRAYPNLDLRLVEGRMPGEEDPDLVISLTKFMSHPLDRGLRKKYGARYCPVNGAADSVKAAIRDRLQLPYAH